MTHLRDHLQAARREYAAVRYPDDLAAEVLNRPRRWLWRLAVAGCGTAGLAAALLLVVMLDRAGKAPAPASGSAALALDGPVPPGLPEGMTLVPPALPLVPPSFPAPPAPMRVAALDEPSVVTEASAEGDTGALVFLTDATVQSWSHSQ